MYLKESKKRGKFEMTSETLVIRFGGEKVVDFKILNETLDSTVKTLKILADSLINENEYRKFIVTGLQNGCVMITIGQIRQCTPPVLPTILQAFKELIEIRKFLKGLPPNFIRNQENTVSIQNKQGTTAIMNRIAFNGYSNEIEKELAFVVSKAVESKGLFYTFINSFGEESFYFDKELLSCLSVPQDVEKFLKKINETEKIAYVNVRIPDLAGNTKWICIWNGRDIACDMCDESFLERVHNGEISFTGSTQLYVNLLVRYKETEILSYGILKVFEIMND